MGEKSELNHMAFIPDGNRRWARENKKDYLYAYRLGADRAKAAINEANSIGIHTVTFWGLSTENWLNRTPEELECLVEIFVGLANEYIEEASEHGVKVVHLGRKDRLPQRLLESLDEVVRVTEQNTEHVLNLALDYGGHDESERASKKIAQAVLAGELDWDELDMTVGQSGSLPIHKYAEFLDTAHQPYPFLDFVVRTSGEQRLSGFMPYQSAYAELHFEPDYWPDFDPVHFEEAVEEFYGRQRRFGGDNNG